MSITKNQNSISPLNPGQCVQIEYPEEGLAVLTLNPPHRKLTVLDQPLLEDLKQAIQEIESKNAIEGVIVKGKTAKIFAAGADIEGILNITKKSDAYKIVNDVHQIFNRIANLKATTVAAVGGPVPGGAYELALACDYIVALNDRSTKIGLPETKLGIIPGWGGSHRLPKRIGLLNSIDAILNGSLYDAKRALKKGMIDRIAYKENLLSVAANIAMNREIVKKKKSIAKQLIIERNPIAKALIGHQTRKVIEKKTKGNYPAQKHALSLILKSNTADQSSMIKREAKSIAELATGEVSKALINIFFESNNAKKSFSKNDLELHTIGTIGAGVMGGSIASLCAEKGINSRLIDLSQKALDEATFQHQTFLKKKKRKRKENSCIKNNAIDNLTTSKKIHGINRCQIMIEAVAEEISIKKKVLKEVIEKTDASCIIATNTSSLSIKELAEDLDHPERIVGMHFFNPVRKMPLVEIIKGESSSELAINNVAQLAIKLGKIPIVVKDVPGFLINRLLGPYLDEAIRLFSAGIAPQRIEKVAQGFGMPMGPLRLLDEVGLDIAANAAASLYKGYGERMKPNSHTILEFGRNRLGKKTKRGFYNFYKNKAILCDDLKQFQPASPKIKLTNEQISDRLILSMVNEAAKCIEEEIVENEARLNLATVLGMGFPPFRGGLIHWVRKEGKSTLSKKLSSICQDQDIVNREGGVAKFSPSKWLTSTS